MQQYRLNIDRIQHSFAEKDMEALVDQAWNTSQRYIRAEKVNHILVYMNEQACSQQDKGSYIFRTEENLCSGLQTSSEVLCPALSFLLQGRHWHHGVSPAVGHQDY